MISTTRRLPAYGFAVACALALAVVLSSSVVAFGWTKKTAAESWTWFEDYAFVSASYHVACEPARECQVGMGVFAFGQPRGEKISFRGDREITVIGFGALYFRATDSKGPVKAAFQLKDARLVPVADIKW